MANKVEKFKTLLLARKAELEELNAISAEARETVTLDQQSVG
ncbi:MAG: hypothetical protein ACJAZW_003109, partial [Maritalea sp.]